MLAKPLAEDALIQALAPWFGTDATTAPRSLTATATPASELDGHHLRLLNRQGLLPTLIEAFENSLDERFCRLRNEPAQGPALLHALAGASASVALRGVAQEAWTLELALRGGRTLEAEDMDRLLRRCREGLALLRQAQDPPAPA